MARKYPFTRIQKILNGEDPNSLAMDNLGKFLSSTSVLEIEEIKKEFDNHGSRLPFLALKYGYPIREHILQWNDPAIQASIYDHLIEASCKLSNPEDLFKGPCNIVNYLNTCESDIRTHLIEILISETSKIKNTWHYSVVYEYLLRSKSTHIASSILNQRHSIKDEDAIHIIEVASKNKNEGSEQFLDWWEHLDPKIQAKNIDAIGTAFNNAYFENTARMLLAVYNEFNQMSPQKQHQFNERYLYDIDRYAKVHPENVRMPLAIYQVCTIAIHARLMNYPTYSKWANHKVLSDNIKVAFDLWDLHDNPQIILQALRPSNINRELPTFDLNEVLC